MLYNHLIARESNKVLKYVKFCWWKVYKREKLEKKVRINHKERKSKARKERRQDRGKEGKLMSSTAFYYSSSFAGYNVLYRSPAKAVVLLLITY